MTAADYGQKTGQHTQAAQQAALALDEPEEQACDLCFTPSTDCRRCEIRGGEYLMCPECRDDHEADIEDALAKDRAECDAVDRGCGK